MMKKSDIIHLKSSDLIKAILPIKGKPIDLEGYKPFELLYNINPPSLCVSSSRQVGKSLYLGNRILSRGILTTHSAALYVAPLSQQASRFSTMYLDPGLNSPIVKHHFTGSGTKKNVFEKSLTNQSIIFLGYAESAEGVDRLRGISISGPGPTGATCYIDEVQDIQSDALSVIFETMSAAEYPRKVLTGTAKSEHNTLQRNFMRGSQCEWCVKCDSCGKWCIPKDIDTCMRIVRNRNGPGCPFCDSILDMSKGQWVAARPNERNNLSFHTPAMIMPIRNKASKWEELMEKVDTYSAAQLANEVFGLPSATGSRILSTREAMACCNPERTSWDTEYPTDRGILFTVVGVDWAVASSAKACHTVVSVLGFDMYNKCHVLYVQKLDGIDVLDQVKRVKDLYIHYKCTAIGSDRGVGVPQGLLLKRHLGEDRVHMINYVTSKTMLRIDRQGGYFAADRTSAIDLLMFKAKAGFAHIETPCWDLCEKFWQDALNMFEETTNVGRRIYDKLDDQYDDVAHSWVFGIIASMIVRGDFTEVDEAEDRSSIFTF